MSLPLERRDAIAHMSLPSDAEMVQRARRFLMSTGMTTNELSEAIGLAPSSLRVWLCGAYSNRASVKVPENNTRNIRALLKTYIDQHEIIDTVRLETPHQTADYVAIRKAVRRAMAKGTACVLDGPPGTQKTFSLRSVEHEINASGSGRAVYVYARSNQPPQSFLVEACTAAGVPSRGNIDQLLKKLRHFLGRERVVLIVDEAQHLPDHTLETLRQLLDLPPYFGVVLSGNDELSSRLSHWRMAKWRERLRKTFVLTGPTQDEARSILRQELPGLPADAVNSILAGLKTTAVRFVKGRPSEFEYISARLLFFAIEDAKERLAERKPNGVHVTANAQSARKEATA